VPTQERLAAVLVAGDGTADAARTSADPQERGA
jgi:hypothetical protein